MFVKCFLSKTIAYKRSIIYDIDTNKNKPPNIMIVNITYDDSDFNYTQPYLITVNGKEFMRCTTHARAELTIMWHQKNGTLEKK